MPRDVPSADIHRILEKVGLGAQETELTRMVKEVKALEERLAKMEEGCFGGKRFSKERIG